MLSSVQVRQAGLSGILIDEDTKSRKPIEFQLLTSNVLVVY